MKYVFIVLVSSLFLFSCGSDDDGNNEKVKAFCNCAMGDNEFKSSDECKAIAEEMKKKLNSEDEKVRSEALQEYKEMFAMCK